MPSAAVLLREGIWDSLLHPRASAGSTGGGQFTSGGHGASGGHAKAHISKGHAPKHGKGGGGKKPKGPSKLLAYNPKTNTGPGYNMPHGDPRVHQLQEALTRLGVGDAKGKALVDDGKLGPLTTQAIQAAQTKLGLKPTGRVTPVLLNRILTAKVLAPAHKGRVAKTVKAKAPRKRRVVLVHQSATAGELLFGHSAAVAALESWDEMLHPRGPGGKFAKLGDEERASRRKARNEARRTARAAAKTGGTAAKTVHAVEKPHTHESILAHASTMSDEDLGKLHEAIAAMHHDRQAKAAASAVPKVEEHATPDFVPTGHGLNGPVAGAEPSVDRFMAKYHTAMSQGEYAEAAGHLDHAAMSTKNQELADSINAASTHIARNAPGVSGPAHNPEEHRQLAAAHHAAANPDTATNAAEWERRGQELANAQQPANHPAHSDVHAAIHAAYTDLAPRPGAWVGLAPLREHPAMRGHSREDVDAELTRISRANFPQGRVEEETNQKTLSRADREAAVDIGRRQNHVLQFDADYRPAPAPSEHQGKGWEDRGEQMYQAALKKLAGPDVSHHTVQLDMLRAQLNPTNISAPIEQAQKYVAGVKGAELTALAKHYGTGGRTAAEKRRNIVQARLGMLGDAMAIHPHGYAGGSR